MNEHQEQNKQVSACWFCDNPTMDFVDYCKKYPFSNQAVGKVYWRDHQMHNTYPAPSHQQEAAGKELVAHAEDGDTDDMTAEEARKQAEQMDNFDYAGK